MMSFCKDWTFEMIKNNNDDNNYDFNIKIKISNVNQDKHNDNLIYPIIRIK